MELGLIGAGLVLAAIAYYWGRKQGGDKAYRDMYSGVGGGSYNRDGGLRGDREPPRK